MRKEETNPDPDIAELEKASSLYDLAAVLIHKGVSAHGGHYVAHVKNEE